MVLHHFEHLRHDLQVKIIKNKYFTSPNPNSIQINKWMWSLRVIVCNTDFTEYVYIVRVGLLCIFHWPCTYTAYSHMPWVSCSCSLIIAWNQKEHKSSDFIKSILYCLWLCGMFRFYLAGLIIFADVMQMYKPVSPLQNWKFRSCRQKKNQSKWACNNTKESRHLKKSLPILQDLNVHFSSSCLKSQRVWIGLSDKCFACKMCLRNLSLIFPI